ncbi:DMT family transporter [Martelella alba]|nr:DMT family transporter [Martelella alba]
MKKIRVDISLVIFVNMAVLLNWGGLIMALKYLEPAIVGIASVACGPAITIILSRLFLRVPTKPTRLEKTIAWVILVGVALMLGNAYLGKSGMTATSQAERVIGIICVLCSAIGTVIYTLLSKQLDNKGWGSYDILGMRNILMLLLATLYCHYNGVSLVLDWQWLLVVLILSVIGHIVPIVLMQRSISILDPLHISLMLLLLPVFTLALQFLDPRIAVARESISAVVIILVLLCLLAISKSPAQHSR